jgi:hypothetical protein
MEILIWRFAGFRSTEMRHYQQFSRSHLARLIDLHTDFDQMLRYQPKRCLHVESAQPMGENITIRGLSFHLFPITLVTLSPGAEDRLQQCTL